MGFCQQLEENNIDPDQFIAYLQECLAEYRQLQELNRALQSYRENLDREHMLDMMEKFVTKLERERLQQKIRNFT